MMIVKTGETVHTSLKYGHVDYTICMLNFISVKNSKYQLYDPILIKRIHHLHLFKFDRIKYLTLMIILACISSTSV